MLQDIIRPNMQPRTPTPFPTGTMFATPTSQAPIQSLGPMASLWWSPSLCHQRLPHPSPLGPRVTPLCHPPLPFLPRRSRSPMGSLRSNAAAGTAAGLATPGQLAQTTNGLAPGPATLTITKPPTPSTSPRRYSHSMRRRSLSTRPSAPSCATYRRTLSPGSGEELVPTRALRYRL
jgi:hypothetical protein